MTRISEKEFAQLTGQPARRSKYNNTIVNTEDGKFDSKREYARWCELKIMQRAGLITDLRRQVPYDLRVNGLLVCRYVADFVYEENGETVVVDVKGIRTDVFVLKRKLMKAVYNIEIQEVK
jgi:hypothetical protein